MSIYRYQAKSPHGKIIKGKYQADSSDAVASFLKKQNYIPLDIKKRSLFRWQNMKSWLLYIPLSKSVSLFFLLELSSILKSGMSFGAAMEYIATSSSVYRLRLIARNIQLDLLQGIPFWDSLKKYRFVLRNMLPNFNDSGDWLGNVSLLFEYTYKYHSTKRSLSRKILLARLPQLCSLVFLFVLYLYFGNDLFPQYIAQIKKFRTKTLPVFSVFVSKWISFIYLNWYFILIVLVVVWLLIYIAYKIKPLKLVIDYCQLWLYPMSILTKGLQLSVFFNYFYLHLMWGETSQKAIHRAAMMLDNGALRRRALQISHFLSRGMTMASATKKTRLFPVSMQLLFSIPSRAQLMASVKELIDNQTVKLELTASILSQLLRGFLYVLMVVITLVYLEAWWLLHSTLAG